MPLEARPIAIRIAVICFFVFSLTGWNSGHLPSTCGKRALIAAGFAYIATGLIVKVVNAILIHAMVASRMNKQKENTRDNKN